MTAMNSPVAHARSTASAMTNDTAESCTAPRTPAVRIAFPCPSRAAVATPAASRSSSTMTVMRTGPKGKREFTP